MIGNLLRVKLTDLEAYLIDSSLLEDFIYNDDEADQTNLIDIDKAWEGILYLLTGQSLAEVNHPLAAVLFSGQLIDDEQDLGYGPANYLTAEEVSLLNEQIFKITATDLKARFNPSEMNQLGIYPEGWDEGDESFDYLYEYFCALQQFYAQAAANREAVITFLN